MTIGEMKSYVACENPKVIVNPRFRQYEIIPCYDKFFYRDFDGTNRVMNVLGVRSHDACLCILYSFLCTSQDNSVVDDFYFLNSETGETAMPFVAVRCNHCVVCEESKKNDLCLRAQFQAESDRALPYFITLTYDNEHLPADGVDKKAVCSFIKRFKTYYERYYGLDSKTLKFLVTSEYGKLSRPHYHILLFGYDCRNTDSLYRTRALYKLIKYTWSQSRRNIEKFDDFKPNGMKFLDDDSLSFGAVEVKICDSVSGAVKYVTKYMTKDLHANAPAGKNPNFRITPYNFGTLFFFKVIAPQIRASMRNDVKYLPYCSTQIKELHVTRYYINKLFPCVSTVITGDDKKLYQHLLGYYEEKAIELPKVFDFFDTINFSRCNFTFDYNITSERADILTQRFARLADKMVAKFGNHSFSWFQSQRNILNTSSPRVPYPIASRKLSIQKYNSQIIRKL